MLTLPAQKPISRALLRAWVTAAPGTVPCPTTRSVFWSTITCVKAGVDLDGVIWQETGRVGTFYVEFAAPPRATQVIYDRADSCVTRVTPDMIHWDKLLDTRLIHLTGITPALSPSCA